MSCHFHFKKRINGFIALINKIINFVYPYIEVHLFVIGYESKEQ